MSPHFRTLALMAKNAGMLTSKLMRLKDETIAMAVDTAATLLLFEQEQDLEKLRDSRRAVHSQNAMMQAMAVAMTGKDVNVKWDTERELS
mgnify:CR=1 FL=1